MCARDFPIKGRRVLIRVDPIDAVGPDFSEVKGTVVKGIPGRDGFSGLTVRPDQPLTLRHGFTVGEILVIGLGMDPVRELEGVRTRPPGLPVLVKMYRIRDEPTRERIVNSDFVPPATEYLGRGEIYREGDEIPTYLEQQLQSIRGQSEQLRRKLLTEHGITVSYDQESLLKLDDIIDRVMRTPLSKDEIGAAVAPWAAFLTDAVAVAFSGELFKDPADGIKVRISTPRGTLEISPALRMWARFEHGKRDDTSIAKYIRELRRKKELNA